MFGGVYVAREDAVEVAGLIGSVGTCCLIAIMLHVHEALACHSMHAMGDCQNQQGLFGSCWLYLGMPACMLVL